MFVFRALFCMLALVGSAFAQIPCDDAYGQYCPEATGWEVATCLKKQSGLTEPCLDFIKTLDACKNDIDKLCTGMEYTGEAIPCLTERTKPEDLSSSCLASLPIKEVKEKTLSAEEKAKASKRRSKRKQAAKIAREF